MNQNRHQQKTKDRRGLSPKKTFWTPRRRRRKTTRTDPFHPIWKPTNLRAREKIFRTASQVSNWLTGLYWLIFFQIFVFIYCEVAFCFLCVHIFQSKSVCFKFKFPFIYVVVFFLIQFFLNVGYVACEWKWLTTNYVRTVASFVDANVAETSTCFNSTLHSIIL